MQSVAMSPKYLKREVAAEVVEKEREIYKAKMEGRGDRQGRSGGKRQDL